MNTFIILVSNYISGKVYQFIVCPTGFECTNLFPYHPTNTGFIFTDFLYCLVSVSFIKNF